MDEKSAFNSSPPATYAEQAPHAGDDDFEVFKKSEGQIDYRTTGWMKTTALMFKVLFSVGVLSIPSLFSLTGWVGGIILILGWGVFNWYVAVLLGAFRNRHAHCHGIQDCAMEVGGVFYRELLGVLFILGYVLVTASGVLASGTALNALSNHGACTVVFNVVTAIMITMASAVPRFSNLSYLAWIGCASIYVAVFIVMVGVTQNDPPAGAPPGVTDNGFRAFAEGATFEGVMTTNIVIFVSSAASSGFLPMMSEMKNPKDYKKSVTTALVFLNASYVVFAMVIYKYCGIYIASPSLGSAGPVIKKVSYGVGFVGILMSSMINLHIASKYVFVRALRNSRHLQDKTTVHWATWFGITGGLGALAWLLAEVIPFFNSLLGLLAALCFAPMAIVVPMHLWMYDFGKTYMRGNLRQKAILAFHIFFFFVGCYMTVAGSYSAIRGIVDQFNSGAVGKVFDCADNSNSS